MKMIRSQPLFYFGLGILILLIQSCGTFPSSIPGSEFTVTAVKSSTPISTSTATATVIPTNATLTEYARQAEGTRQALMDTQVAVDQNADATATARSLGATASALAPQPPVDLQVEVQANVIWQDTKIIVRRGDTIKIHYVAGGWSIGRDVDPLTDGKGQLGRGENCQLMPQANLGSLVGSVGITPPFLIGNEAEIYSDYDGNLYLAMNDCGDFTDNEGALTVAVVIDR